MLCGPSLGQSSWHTLAAVQLLVTLRGHPVRGRPHHHARLWHLESKSVQPLELLQSAGFFEGSFWSPCQQLLLLTHQRANGLQLSTYSWQQPEAAPAAVQSLHGNDKWVLAWGLCGLLVIPVHLTPGSGLPIEGSDNLFDQLQSYHQEREHFVLARTISLGGWCNVGFAQHYALLPDSSMKIIMLESHTDLLGCIANATNQVGGQRLAIVDTRSGLVQCPPGFSGLSLYAFAPDASFALLWDDSDSGRNLSLSVFE